MNKIKQKFHDLKIRTKLTILLFVVGLVPIAILGLSLGISAHNTVIKNRQADMGNTLSQSCAAVSSQAAVCEQMMHYFAYDANVIEFLECSPEERTKRFEYYQEVRSTISALRYQNLILETLTLYSEGITQTYGAETKTLEELYNQHWYQEGQEETWIYDDSTLAMVSIYKIPSYTGLISYAVATTDIPTMFQSLEQLAVGNYGIHVEGAEEIWNFSGEDCVDENGVYLSFTEDNRRFLWVEEEIAHLNLKVYYFTPKANTNAISWGQVLQVLVQIGFCLILIYFLGRMFSDYISKPLELLTMDIQAVDGERLETAVTSRREDEIGILIQSYNHMLARIQELIEENYKTRIAQKEFEMKALQAQINPHFLYNSLSMINWKAIEAGQPEISRITLDLSAFYRTTLNRGKTMNTIRNAVENIRAYLALQLNMHDEDFVVHYEIDEETYGYDIPLLIFQPFVENALEHGLDLKEDADHQMWIRITQDKREIQIQIQDNGIGMEPEVCAHILEYDAKGYGVKNVNDRMRLHYGEEYGIRVESQTGLGTTVTMRFPKEQGGASHA